MIFTHVYHISLIGGPMDGLDVQSLIDPGEILVYRPFHLDTRRWSWHYYLLETSYNFERHYRFKTSGPIAKPPKRSAKKRRKEQAERRQQNRMKNWPELR